MLRFDADVRRKNSITDGKLPVLGSSLKKVLSPAQQAGLTADGKKKLTESKTQKEIEAAKAGKTAAANTGTGAAPQRAAAAGPHTTHGNEDDTGDDGLQFAIDGNDEV